MEYTAIKSLISTSLGILKETVESRKLLKIFSRSDFAFCTTPPAERLGQTTKTRQSYAKEENYANGNIMILV